MKINALITGGTLGALAVILGAMGAHALKPDLTVTQLQSYETAVRFQMYHAIAILVIGWINQSRQSRTLRISNYLFLLGTVLFSGSIYVLSTQNVTGISGIGWLGPVTPLGGLSLISGWILIVREGFKK